MASRNSESLVDSLSPDTTAEESNRDSNQFRSLGEYNIAPIAICGVGLRLPGRIKNVDTLWHMLKTGQDARGPVPLSRYQSEGFDNSLGNKGAIKTRYGYFLEDDISHFDPAPFSLSLAETEKTDPQQRLLLEVVKECFESAGEVQYRGSRIGCYVGTFGEDWLQAMSKETQHSGGYTMTGSTDIMLANRISYENDLHGPSMVIKTGCSASLIALHEAFRAVQFGDCDGAIVAGTNLILGPTMTAAMTSEGILSPEGSCKSFDAAADGFARAESVTAIYVHRLDRAIQKGLPVRAIITNTGTNSDGRSQGLLQPSHVAQAELMRKVHQDVKSDPRRLAFVECHGTGTPTGDPIEMKAIGEIFGSHGVYIGSVKPNLGHSEGASGLTSVVKCLLMLEKCTILPNIKFNKPNPDIDFTSNKLLVPLEPTAWPTDRDFRVAVNSFGIGGSNAHAVMEHPYIQMARMPKIPRLRTPGQGDLQLLLFSASTEKSLEVLVQEHLKYALSHPQLLSDIAYSLIRHREHRPCRKFAVCTGTSEPDVSPMTKISDVNPGITMIFSGQGAQWCQMGHGLLQNDPAFLSDIRAMDRALQRSNHPPTWSIEVEISRPLETGKMDVSELSQPLCTALQLALVRYLGRRGIRPHTVIGHSSGEVAAAFATGSLSMEEAIVVAYYRGYILRSDVEKNKGGMAVIGLSELKVQRFLRKGLVIACENSPDSVTISGHREVLDATLQDIRVLCPEVFVRKLRVDTAYHSPLIKEAAAEYLTLLQAELRSGKTPSTPIETTMYSSVLSARIDPARLRSPEYWTLNLLSPVKFSTAAKLAISNHPKNVILEIGPHSVLAGPVRQVSSDVNIATRYVPTLIRSLDATQCMLTCVGRLYQFGILMNPEALAPVGTVLTDLPTYPWDHSVSYWYESRITKDWRCRKFGHHDLLGQRVLATSPDAFVWRVMLDLDDVPWLNDHKVAQDVVLPFACYVIMAGEAFHQLSGVSQNFSIYGMTVKKAILLPGEKSLEIVTTLRPNMDIDRDDTGNDYRFSVSSYTGSTWIQHCEGRIKSASNVHPSLSSKAPLSRTVLPETWYGLLARSGLLFGPSFRLIQQLTVSPIGTKAVSRISNLCHQWSRPGFSSSNLIDATFQTALAARTRSLSRNMVECLVPVSVDEFHMFETEPSQIFHASCTELDNVLSLDCTTDTGQCCLRWSGLQLAVIEKDRDHDLEDKYGAACLEWVPDISFQDISLLPKSSPISEREKILTEELALLCISGSRERLQRLEPCAPHFQKYQRWLNKVVDQTSTDSSLALLNPEVASKLLSQKRESAIEQRLQQLSDSSTMGPMARSIHQIYQNISDIYTGQSEALELLTEENKLTQMYDAVTFDYGSFVKMLSDKKPTLRILEVGAGTGGTTECILRKLNERKEFQAYSRYTFTDISAGFFSQAKNRFAYAANLEYKVLDITQNPLDQGFEAASYDLVVAANVVHATPSLLQTLTNLYTLLDKGGQLLLFELCTKFRAQNFIFGTFSGWWLGEADDRPWEPHISIDRWKTELQNAGFSEHIDVTLDSQEPYQWFATLIAHKKTSPLACTDTVMVLSNDPKGRLCQAISASLSERGIKSKLVDFHRRESVSGDCIVTVDLENPYFKNIAHAPYESFKHLCQSLGQHNMLWLMPPTQVACNDPDTGQTLGIIRGVRYELDASIFTLEIDPKAEIVGKIVTQMILNIWNPDEAALQPDREFVFHNNCVKIGRYRPIDFHRLGTGDLKNSMSSSETLQIAGSDLSKTSVCRDQPAVATVPADHVEIDARAVGLDYPFSAVNGGEKKAVHKVYELSGVVSRKGANVDHLKIGDRVSGIGCGCFGSAKCILNASLVAKTPDELTFEAAAASVLSYTTVLYSLLDIGQLESKQRVLVHEASCDIGYAAIVVCQMIGAEIYVSCGTQAEASDISETFSIAEHHIIVLRGGALDLMLVKVTNGHGIDLVLDSGHALKPQSLWSCVGECGKLIEIDHRDKNPFGRAQILGSMTNRSYANIDFGSLVRLRPQRLKMAFERFVSMQANRQIKSKCPPARLVAVNMESTVDSFRDDGHNRRIPTSFPTHSSEHGSLTDALSLTLDSTATYMLTGGFGGLGIAIARWLVECGARNLLVLSRSAGQRSSHKRLLIELESMGCQTIAVQGEAQNYVDVQRAVQSARSPIKGVFHLAMLLRDAMFVDMTYEDFKATVSPKVDGMWNLHRLLGPSLDFLVMTSSLISIFYQPGQSNYHAANAFLEAFCQYRHQQGLPASVLSVGAIEDLGYLADNPGARNLLKSQGLCFLDETALLRFVKAAILNSNPSDALHSSSTDTPPWSNKSHIIMGLKSAIHLDDPRNRATWRRDRRMGSYHNISDKVAVSERTTTALEAFLQETFEQPTLLSTDASKDFLSKEIGAKLSSLTMNSAEELSPATRLSTLGMDSLIAIELRRWWKKIFSCDISVLELTASETLAHLGLLAAQALERRE